MQIVTYPLFCFLNSLGDFICYFVKRKLDDASVTLHSCFNRSLSSCNMFRIYKPYHIKHHVRVCNKDQLQIASMISQYLSFPYKCWFDSACNIPVTKSFRYCFGRSILPICFNFIPTTF